ncbi:MAG: Ribosomal RNA small subunit methyltransferase I [Candidatus Anoxychlamydiales bacterium]|nr:Ribosomal RNA small subunit methyltransferase I [Candidatus Anoxychlamydiales bacterium]NGX36043.1 Ribosomal RNA small subunit methyltransferase I [Candidatus Anoxychlamydiales bacterium]
MTLILLPNLIDDSASIDLYFPKDLKDIILSLDGLIAENEKNARRYLLRFIDREKMQKIKIRLLNEHTTSDEIKVLLNLIKNENFGLISDAGLPCIADPGSKLVFLSHQSNIEVKALTGPSSIFLALMLSGLNGQKFAFQGYLPRDENQLIQKIKFLESESLKQKQTQIFIEAPYRSDKLLNILKKSLNKNTLLSIAINLSSKDEKVITQKVSFWQKQKLIIGKNPAIFLFSSDNHGS